MALQGFCKPLVGVRFPVPAPSPVGATDCTPPCEGGGKGFDSLTGHHGSLAHRIEQ